MTEYSLELKFENKTVFSSNGKWLHPLLDMEDFLNRENYDPAKLMLYDKIIGKASALMIIRLGIGKVAGGIVSKPAETVFKKWDVEYSSKKQIDYIDCRTEQILMDISDPEEVYQLIRVRAGLK
ncbi:MAG: DUF1893 domain-containing protein [Spirochaetales bacterium]|nr:DUF1893 domain-containing protein [Spirochaetales bacterium]